MGIDSFRRAGMACITVLALGMVFSSPAFTQTAPAQDFPTFLQELKQEALGKGMKPETLSAAFDDVRLIDRVVELDRKQPEFTLTFDEYLTRVVSSARIEKGRALYAQHKDLLEDIGRHYGVQPRFILALWGIETDYGRITGGFPVISSLVTLAYEGRRSAFFRKELFHALTIIDEGHIRPEIMKGSWAGAMGQPQFMPSSFVNYAQDWDGDGRKDIWGTKADVFASAANYLSKSGWASDMAWGRKVKIGSNFDKNLAGLETKKSLEEWSRLGVRAADGSPLPHKQGLEASLIFPNADKSGPAYLVYDNFRTIMKWNRSIFYALAAGHLADKIGAR